MSILIAILVFGLVILVHECGHFFAARRCGIWVEEFAIGMGPKLLSKQFGETVYSLRLVPIGGFCKMHGEDQDCVDENAFNGKKVSQRMMVMLAGALMNFALAFIIFLIMTLLGGYAIPTIRSLAAGAPAEQYGLQPGDTITSVNGKRIFIYEDLLFALGDCDGQPLTIGYTRDHTRHTVVLTPYQNEYGEYKIGFVPDSRLGLLSGKIEGEKRVGVLDTIGVAVGQIYFYVKVTVIGVVRLVTLQANMADMSGPIGIVSVIGETYEATVAQSILSAVFSMANLCALISANLGVFNLLPLPALDGGRLVFLIFEGIRRKPVPAEREGMVHFVGFVLLMILAVFIAYQDIVKML